MRPLALLALLALVLASSCGSVCDSSANAERNANQKATGCNLQNITVHDANKCNQNLQKCNSEDLKELDNYARCLDQLPVCTTENQTSFNFSRLGCVLQPLGRLSNTCTAGIL